MKLNRLGRLGLNSPTRAFVQRHAVAPLLERLGGRVAGGRVLELGCGRGVGGEIILDRFGAAHLELIDIDPDMVQRARRRLAGRPATLVRVGDATRIEAPDGSFDAVFDFGAIHQIPDWSAAVVEIRRVLKPGARFFFEEVASPALRWTLRFTVDGWPPHCPGGPEIHELIGQQTNALDTGGTSLTDGAGDSTARNPRSEIRPRGAGAHQLSSGQPPRHSE